MTARYEFVLARGSIPTARLSATCRSKISTSIFGARVRALSRLIDRDTNGSVNIGVCGVYQLLHRRIFVVRPAGISDGSGRLTRRLKMEKRLSDSMSPIPA